MNGIDPYGDMAALITVAEKLHALLAETIAFSETNIEWHTFQLRDNMQKLLTKAFGAARMEYSTTSDKFETTYHKCKDAVEVDGLWQPEVNRQQDNLIMEMQVSSGRFMNK
jgi:hypothetical protein